MTPAGGASGTGVSDVVAGAPAAAALLAQLQRLQQQLSECVNCADGKTAQGKATADAIRARIGEVEARIAHSDQVSERRAATLNAGKSEPAASLAAASGSVTRPAKTSGIGQIIDVFA